MNRIDQIIALYLNAHDTDTEISTAPLRSLRSDDACRFYAHEGNDYIILKSVNENTGAWLYTAIGMTNIVYTDIRPLTETGMGTVILHLTSDSYMKVLQAVTETMLIDAE